MIGPENFIAPRAAQNPEPTINRRNPLNATNIVHTLCTNARKKLDQPIHLNRETVCTACVSAVWVSGARAGASRDSFITLLHAESATEISLPVPLAARIPVLPAEPHFRFISRRSAVPSFPASHSAIFAPRPAESDPLTAGTACAFSDRAPWCARSSSSGRFQLRNICPPRPHTPQSMCPPPP